MKQIIIASNNAGKVRELKQLLQPLGYEVISQSEAGFCIEADETGKTFEANALLKAEAVYKNIKSKGHTGVLADDSGLCVDALGGAPGVDTAHYNIEWLLEQMRDVPDTERTAEFVCCLCLKDKSGERFFTGRCKGQIGFECRGDKGFGYDPIFMVGNNSFAEMTDSQKNQISHRGRALRKLVEELL